MMRAVEDHFRTHGCGTLEITGLSLRQELLPIYRRFGFVETGTEGFHYPHPLTPGLECHCIVMQKPLQTRPWPISTWGHPLDVDFGPVG